MTKIFISYRRVDSAFETGSIEKHLVDEFRRHNVFKDVNSTPLGRDFRKCLDEAMSRCHVVLVVIGDGWLDAKDASGNRRIDKANDYVRLEVETALDRGIPVIPLLLEKAKMPKADELPKSIGELSFRHATKIRADPDFTTDIALLIKAIKKQRPAPVTWKRKIVIFAVVCVAALGIAALVKFGLGALSVPAKDKMLSPAIPADPAKDETVIAATPADATKDTPFENARGMRFVPVPITGGPSDGKRILFSIWETRVKDYAEYAVGNSDINTDWMDVYHEGLKQEEDHPVVNVSWDDANQFCGWLSRKEGRNYRLPTDHEWSCAVGIGDRETATKSPGEKHEGIEGKFPWGNTWPPPEKAGNYASDSTDGYQDQHPFTAPVGSYRENEFGLCDLGGNVWEWSEDWNSEKEFARVARGASWYPDKTEFLLSSFRLQLQPDTRYSYAGFRVVLTEDSED